METRIPPKILRNQVRSKVADQQKQASGIAMTDQQLAVPVVIVAPADPEPAIAACVVPPANEAISAPVVRMPVEASPDPVAAVVLKPAEERIVRTEPGEDTPVSPVVKVEPVVEPAAVKPTEVEKPVEPVVASETVAVHPQGHRVVKARRPAMHETGVVAAVEPVGNKVGGQIGFARPLMMEAHRGSLPEITPDLPVLDAFQKFLEKERRREKGRVAVLSVAIAVMVVVGLVGFISVRDSLETFRGEMSGLSGTVRASSDESSRAAEALDVIRAETASLRKQIEAGQKLVDGLKDKLESEVVSPAEEIAQLKTLIETVKAQNEALAGELETVRAGIPSGDVSQSIRDELDALNSKPMDLRSTLEEETYESIEVSIRSPSVDDAVVWRLPIPEQE